MRFAVSSRAFVCTLLLLGALFSMAVDASSTSQRLKSRLKWSDDGWPAANANEDVAIESRQVTRNEDAKADAADDNQTRLVVLRDQCPSVNDQACSGHGNCVRDAAAMIGATAPSSSGGNVMMCHCQKGWFGTGCHLTLDQFTQRQKKRQQLANLLSSASAGSATKQTGSPSDDLQRTAAANDYPETSIFSRRFPSSTPVSAPEQRPDGQIFDADEPNSPSQALESFVHPSASEVAADRAAAYTYRNLQGAANYVEQKREPSQSDLFRAMTGERDLALYTNSNGQSIVAPPVYKGQQTIRENAPDPSAIHLIDALNQHHRREQLARNGLA